MKEEFKLRVGEYVTAGVFEDEEEAVNEAVALYFRHHAPQIE